MHALEPLQLLLELLIAVLQLFHIAGEVADRGLEAVDAGDEIGGGHLGLGGAGAKHAGERDHGEGGGANHSRRHFR